MKLTFLGTAAGLPRKNHACSSSMIEVGGKYYIIDAGAPVVNKLLDMDKTIEDIEALFVTHSHSDHLFGIIDLIRCVNIPKIFPEADIDYYLPEECVIAPIKNYFKAAMGEIREDVNRFHVYSEGVIFEDENIKITAIPTQHMKLLERPSYAFLVGCEKKKILFTGDLSQNLKFDDFPKVAYNEHFDAIVCEGAHFDFDVLRPYIEKCNTDRVFFNHIKLPNKPIIEAVNASGEISFPMILVNDGDSFEL